MSTELRLTHLPSRSAHPQAPNADNSDQGLPFSEVADVLRSALPPLLSLYDSGTLGEVVVGDSMPAQGWWGQPLHV